jgi:chromosomal replication initiation ATPase DnaA
MATQNKIDNVKDDIKAIKERLTHIEKNQREIPDKIINAIAEAFEESIGQMNKDINALKKNSNTITKGIDDIKKMLKN